MKRYHINPKTGNPGICHAKKSCPFGDMDSEHYDSQEQARAGFEKKQEEFYEGIIQYPHTMQLGEHVEKLLGSIEKNGLTPLVVGGSVRDSLAQGVQPKDIDVEVFGSTNVDKLISILKKEGYKVKETGKSFGVLKTTLADGMEIDISLPRRDSLIGAGHRGFQVEVDPTLSLTEASARRDFTLNSMYYSHSTSSLLDAHGGMEDWKNRKLRHTSNAFSEDPLRAIRAMQFASRLDFNVDPSTVEASREMKDRFGELSTERIQTEWEKFYGKSKDLDKGLTFLSQSGWGEHFGIDESNLGEAKFYSQQALAQAREHKIDPAVLGAHALSQVIDFNKREAFLQTTLISDNQRNKVNAIINSDEPRSLTIKEIKRWARELKRNKLSTREFIASRKSFINNSSHEDLLKKCSDLGVLDVAPTDILNGKSVQSLTSKPPGPWMGQLLRKAGSAQDDEVFSDESSAIEWLKNEINIQELIN
jgi:tRNA nucleotidyltransferase/poly(A) polymerase